MPAVVVPPSPPSDDQDQFPRRSSKEILERISPHTPRQSHDLPRPTPQVVTAPPRPTEDISPVSTAVPEAESGDISPMSIEAPQHEYQLPTFAESQEAYGHANPLLAHPVSRPTGHAPLEKMPSDAEQSRSRSHSRSSIDFPTSTFPARKPVPGSSNTFPVAASASSSSTSIPSSSTGNVPDISAMNSIPTPTATVSGPSSHRIPSAKAGFFSQLGHKTSKGFNNLAHKFGGTGFLPDTLDNECEKAAMILKTFCKNGVYADTSKSADQQGPPPDGTASSSATHKRPKTLVTIPSKVINRAVGLAIFTTFRAGLNFKGSTGSGILVAKRHDGSWSGPSAIQLNSVGGGMVVGVDIYDCVCVINTQDSLNAFMDSRVSIGADIAVVAGPWGAGGSVEWGAKVDTEKDKREVSPTNLSNPALPNPPVLEVNGEPAKVNDETRKGYAKSHKKFSTCYSYVKSRGFYAGFGYDGTMMTERKAANTSFYGEVVSAEQILRGQVTPPEENPSLQVLWDVLRGAEGLTPLKTLSTEAIISPPDIVEPVDGPANEGIEPAPMPPPAYPVDSLHPVEAYMPEKR